MSREPGGLTPERDVRAGYRSLTEILSALEDGMLVSVMIPSAMMDFLDESNVDEVIAGLPGDDRSFVLEWAHGAVFTPAHELLHIAGLTNLTELDPEDLKHPREAIALRALRSWFDRHPWPEPATP